ncbi:RNA polymerase sigma-B factor [Kineococcus radiotolerans]|uniref:RNA polymerase sigma-B factor n=1 Tax=Kineococcus radiotolerans TaxID=131568 RepID=A0A7W4TP42_KINRA|nr:RNA polymerase sigma factor SigF [Kineococcus radiotolerans]MBB2902128.1 RNA polymerase sigma-B factor [Kineococcus radiotolerans]
MNRTPPRPRARDVPVARTPDPGDPGVIDPHRRADEARSLPPPAESPGPDHLLADDGPETPAPAATADAEPAGAPLVLPSSRDVEDAPLLSRMASLDPEDPERARLREELTRRHLPLADHLAARFLGRGEPQDDLVQVATIGLLKALDRFDPSRGVPFGAYAVPTMLGEIKRHFRDRGWAMRVPRRIQEAGRALGDAREVLTHELGRAPTVAELAERTGYDPEDVVDVLESANAYSTLPLDTGSPTSLVASLGADDDALQNVENREALRPLLAGLPARERRILALRFVRGMSQSQIAAEVGISQMHVSRLLTRTLAQLREGLGDEAG